MTTLLSTTDSFVDNATDANFRLWGSTISAHFAAVGLVQGTDSGQINWATVVKPTAATTSAGYEIWKLNDSLFATYPIYIKVEYGTDNIATRPATWITIGTGTNGAGTITGPATTRLIMTSGQNAVAKNTYVSRACFVNGFFGCDFYRDIYNSGLSSSSVSLVKFCISRTVDDSGTPTGDGYVFTYHTQGLTSATMQAVNVAKNIVGAVTTAHTLIPGNFNSTLTDDTPGNYQAFKPYQLFPKMRPVFGLATTFGAETAVDTQYSAVLIGTTSRNYICTGIQGYGNQQDSRNANATNLGMLWE